MLQHSRAPSRCYAEGLSVGCNRSALGAAGVPSGAAKVEEAEVRLFFPEGVSVDAKGQLGVRVAQLRRDPAHALAEPFRVLRRLRYVSPATMVGVS